MTPKDLTMRVATARSALGPDAVEWRGSSGPTITATTAEVLCIDALPAEHAAMVSVFEQWRDVLDLDAQVHLIERTRLTPSGNVVTAIRSRLGLGCSPLFERDVVAAVRGVGWTIMAIDRIDVDENGERQRWVELRASDVVGQVRRDAT